MNRYPAPDPAHPIETHAKFNADKASEFYQEHQWLGENVAMSLAAELAFAGCLSIAGCSKEHRSASRQLSSTNQVARGL